MFTTRLASKMFLLFKQSTMSMILGTKNKDSASKSLGLKKGFATHREVQLLSESWHEEGMTCHTSDMSRKTPGTQAMLGRTLTINNTKSLKAFISTLYYFWRFFFLPSSFRPFFLKVLPTHSL